MHSEEYARRQAPTSLKAERNLTRTRTSILKPVSSNFTPDGAAHDTRYAALASACHRGAEHRISGCSSAASCPPTAAAVRRCLGAGIKPQCASCEICAPIFVDTERHNREIGTLHY